MSVKFKKKKPDETREMQEKIRALEDATARVKTFAVSSFQNQIIADRAAGLNLINDRAILAAAEVVKFPHFIDDHYYKDKGEILEYNGNYYEIVAPHRSNAAAYPVETTFAYYRYIDMEHAGTVEDPVPYPETPGIVVNVKSGFYYNYKGNTYIAKLDMPHCVYPPDTPGMWQWEKVVE